MIDKPLRSLNGKKFTGSLAKPIEHGLFMPIDSAISPSLPTSADWPEYLKRSREELHRQRMAKMPDLARHLGIDVEQFNLADPANGFGLSMLLGVVALELASHVVPGFQEKPRGQHPREIIRFYRRALDAAKAWGKIKSDFKGLCEILSYEERYAGAANRSAREKEARQLMNRISKDRRAAGERPSPSPQRKPRPAKKRR